MILSTHAIFGAAVASLVPNHPVAGFTLGFASHFVLDAIPHRDYDLISLEIDTAGKIKPLEIIRQKFRLIRDMILVSLDALLGFLLAFMFFFNPVHPWVFFLGAGASMAPDFFLFLFLIFRHKPLALLFHFHASIIHSKVILKLNQIAGVALQFFTLGLLIAILFGLKYLLINTHFI
jgi:hypothetical protein